MKWTGSCVDGWDCLPRRARSLSFVSFFFIPPTTVYFNAHSHSWPVVKAALLAGLYPNVVRGVAWCGVVWCDKDAQDR